MTRSELHGDTKILFLCIYGWMDWKRNKMHVELTKRKYVSTVVHNVYLLLSISGCVGCVRVRMNIFVLVAYVYLCNIYIHTTNPRTCDVYVWLGDNFIALKKDAVGGQILEEIVWAKYGLLTSRPSPISFIYLFRVSSFSPTTMIDFMHLVLLHSLSFLELNKWYFFIIVQYRKFWGFLYLA